ncbi:transcriptional accessory protein [Ruminococcus sp. CAG:330]|nr:transcriptional accessory protein [Ruminococcus sp. CAG:330]
MFASNLRQLLMAAPLKNRTVLGVDPGYRTGCKLAVVDETGKVLDTGVAHITLGAGKGMEQGKRLMRQMMIQHHVTAVAIGNGTASREAEAVVSELLKALPHPAAYMVVSEAGASVYSASKLAAEEFPEYDVSLRSAVSIARRLQDPLAELVKIDPQAIGVGQYQHDMPKAELKGALDGVVEDCVNRVGVDLNTASFSLLSHIAGISQTIAKNIVAYRTENGAFTDRKQLKKVAKLGPKAFEQCAGFLRVPESANPLDNTGVHPESYKAAEQILQECGFRLADAGTQDLSGIEQIARKSGYAAIAAHAGVGVPTVTDILKELAKPARDPRDELPPPLLRSGDIMELKDLKPGMELTGTVRNIVDFGCFVDVGVHEDGLVHISQICNRFIKHPLEAVKVGDVVQVWVLDVDLKRKRISLTMRKPKGNAGK